MAAIKDVAQMAGLSTAAISKYLRDPESVRDDTRERIEDAISRLNYAPSTAARALRTGRTGMIAVLIPDIKNPFFAELFDILRIEAAGRGYSVILQAAEDTANVKSATRSFAVASVHYVDGAIVCFPDDEKIITAMKGRPDDTPIVLMSWRRTPQAHASVLLDAAGGIRESVMHLSGLGHERIAYVGGPRHSVMSYDKMHGFREGMDFAGLKYPAGYIAHGKFSMKTGYHAARDFWAMKPRPTAIVAENDILAIGCLKYFHKNGVKVPEEAAVTGFDDIPLASMYEPPLTTVRLPLREMGAAAISKLMDIFNGAETAGSGTGATYPEGSGLQPPFRTELIVRKSTDAGYKESI